MGAKPSLLCACLPVDTAPTSSSSSSLFHTSDLEDAERRHCESGQRQLKDMVARGMLASASSTPSLSASTATTWASPSSSLPDKNGETVDGEDGPESVGVDWSAVVRKADELHREERELRRKCRSPPSSGGPSKKKKESRKDKARERRMRRRRDALGSFSVNMVSYRADGGVMVLGDARTREEFARRISALGGVGGNSMDDGFVGACGKDGGEGEYDDDAEVATKKTAAMDSEDGTREEGRGQGRCGHEQHLRHQAPALLLFPSPQGERQVQSPHSPDGNGSFAWSASTKGDDTATASATLSGSGACADTLDDDDNDGEHDGDNMAEGSESESESCDVDAPAMSLSGEDGTAPLPPLGSFPSGPSSSSLLSPNLPHSCLFDTRGVGGGVREGGGGLAVAMAMVMAFVTDEEEGIDVDGGNSPDSFDHLCSSREGAMPTILENDGTESMLSSIADR